MSFFSALDISSTGLTAQRLRMDVISQNIANVDTTKTADGTPYKRKTVLFQEINDRSSFASVFQNALNSEAGYGVRVSKIAQDDTPGTMEYDPTHPDADENGYITKPNVNVVEEMVNMISANRSYEANITAITATKAMIAKTLEMTK